jgi:hypothetical protein
LLQDLIQGLKNLLTDARAESAIIDQMHQSRQKHQHKFWKPHYLLPSTNPKQVYPSTSELVKCSAFGKPNLLKLYAVISTFSHILLPIFKQNFLTASDQQNCSKGPAFSAVPVQKINALKNIDLRALCHPILTGKQILYKAALFHYNG